jgi:hypothetical protein
MKNYNGEPLTSAMLVTIVKNSSGGRLGVSSTPHYYFFGRHHPAKRTTRIKLPSVSIVVICSSGEARLVASNAPRPKQNSSVFHLEFAYKYIPFSTRLHSHKAAQDYTRIKPEKKKEDLGVLVEGLHPFSGYLYRFTIS